MLVYKEVKLALTMNSIHTKEILNSLHENIKVTRHPKSSMDLLWSHHEKIVIIDQKRGYVGGIDLCWGRYDDYNHSIAEVNSDTGTYKWPGIDFANNRILDFDNVDKPDKESIERNLPRMPWHDVMVYMTGPVISDLVRHFIERWDFARNQANLSSKGRSLHPENSTRTYTQRDLNKFTEKGMNERLFEAEQKEEEQYKKTNPPATLKNKFIDTSPPSKKTNSYRDLFLGVDSSHDTTYKQSLIPKQDKTSSLIDTNNLETVKKPE